MNIEKYTERARGFIQSAQSLAVRDGHQQFSSLHMLKVLLYDSEGLAGRRAPQIQPVDVTLDVPSGRRL